MVLTKALCNSIQKPKPTIATGLHTDWEAGKPSASAPWFQNTHLEANKGFGELQDVDVEDDPPTLDSNLDYDKGVSPFLVSSFSCFPNAMNLDGHRIEQ